MLVKLCFAHLGYYGKEVNDMKKKLIKKQKEIFGRVTLYSSESQQLEMFSGDCC